MLIEDASEAIRDVKAGDQVVPSVVEVVAYLSCLSAVSQLFSFIRQDGRNAVRETHTLAEETLVSTVLVRISPDVDDQSGTLSKAFLCAFLGSRDHGSGGGERLIVVRYWGV